MTKVEIINTLTRTFHKAKFSLQKHSPEIMVVAGVVGVVASAVMACKATTKVNAILEETKENVDGIHQVLENPELNKKYEQKYGEVYTEEASKKDLAVLYAQTGLKFVKLYAPSVALGALSITSILAGHNILHKRSVALAAAYATVDQGFKDYRGRVIERFGEELDRELRYNIKAKEIQETVVSEDGTEQTVTKTVDNIETKQYSGYARCFDETCSGWVRDSETNLWFLMRQQDWANEKLKSQGYLFLNDVYKMLGMQQTAAGQQVGWVYDEKNPIGDNYVDFGIHNLHDREKRLFVNGYEKSIWVDFNVDGCILDLMP